MESWRAAANLEDIGPFVCYMCHSKPRFETYPAYEGHFEKEHGHEVNATPVTGRKPLSDLREEMRAVARGERKASPLPTKTQGAVMLDDRLFLKVKIKSLATEARIIRKEELSANNDLKRESLYLHRTRDVRCEQRAALLAYAFIRGKNYKDTENHTLYPIWEPQLKRICALVRKYGYPGTKPPEEGLLKAVKAWVGQEE